MAVPHFSLSDAMREADNVHREDHLSAPGWESVEFPETYEGVNYLFSRFYCTTPDKTEVFATKCSVTAKGDLKALFGTYWNGQGQWDFSTIAKIEILENKGGNNQILYAQHKVLSAASNKKDVVFERTFNDNGNSIHAYAVSVEHPARPEKFQQHSRSFVLFHSAYFTVVSPGVVEIVFVWCYDFNGWVHEKFVTAEKTKVAQRMSKIVKNTPGSQPVLNYSPLKRVGGGHPPASNTYAEYNHAIREAAVPPPEPAHVISPRQNLPPPFKAATSATYNQSFAQPTFTPTPVQPVQSAPAAVNFCPSCGTRAAGGNFCASCGAKLR